MTKDSDTRQGHGEDMEHRQRTTADQREKRSQGQVQQTSSSETTRLVVGDAQGSSSQGGRVSLPSPCRARAQLHPTSADIHICIAGSTHIWTGASDIYTGVYAYIANCILRQPIATPCLTCQRTRQKHPRFNRCSALAAAIFTCSTPFHPSPASTARPRLVDTCHIIASEPCHFVHRGHKRYRK